MNAPGTPSRSYLGSFLRGSAASTLSQVLWKGAAFASATVIVRVLPADDAGDFFFLLSTGALCGLLVSLGLSQVIGREGPRFDVDGKPELANRIFRTSLRIVLFAALLMVALTLVTSPTLVWLGAASLGGAIALQTLGASVLRVRDMPFLAEMHQVLIPVIFLTTVIVLAASNAAGLRTVLASRLFLEAAFAIVLILIAIQTTKGGISREPATGLLRRALPLWTTGLAWMAIQQADVVLLGVLRTSEDVAIYAPLLRLAELAAVPVGILFPYLLVTAVRLHAGRRIDQLQRLYSSGNKLCVVVASPLLALLVIAPREVTELIFDLSRPETADAARILGLGFFVHALLGGNSAIAEGLVPVHRLVFRSGFALTVTLAANVLFIAWLGTPGAAAGTLVGYVSVHGVNAALLKRHVGLHPLERDVLLTAVVVLALVTLFALLEPIGEGLPAAAIAAGVVVLCAGSVAWGTTPASERAALFEGLGRGRARSG